MLSDLEGLDVNVFKSFMLLYADDIVLFGNSPEELQKCFRYCKRSKLNINVHKTKLMIFWRGSTLHRNLILFTMVSHLK